MNKIIEKRNNQKKREKINKKMNHNRKIMFFPTMNDLLALCFLMNEQQEVIVRSR